MERVAVGVDELVEFWTLLDEDHELLVGERGAGAMAFALELKYYSRHGKFPLGRADFTSEIVEFVSKQLGIEVAELDKYVWSGSTVDYHRSQIRAHLGFRVATVNDQEKLTEWLAKNVACSKRREDRVKAELLAQLRTERIEPPTPGRVIRMVRSALRTAEHNWTLRIAARVDRPASGAPGRYELTTFWIGNARRTDFTELRTLMGNAHLPIRVYDTSEREDPSCLSRSQVWPGSSLSLR